MKIFSYVLNVMSRIDIKNVSLFFPNVATGTTNPYNTNEKNAHAKYMYNKRRRSVIFTCCNIYPEGKRNWQFRYYVKKLNAFRYLVSMNAPFNGYTNIIKIRIKSYSIPPFFIPLLLDYHIFQHYSRKKTLLSTIRLYFYQIKVINKQL